MKYLKLLRVKHYVKNLLILVPLFFSGQMLNATKLCAALSGTVVFCLLSSAIYIVNDLCDIEKDRQHPVKRFRPIASGAVSIRQAVFIAAALLVLSLALASANLRVLPYPVAYLILNLAYSFGLKNTALLDICILVSGFLIRILFGGAVTGIAVSSWLYLTILSLSFYFALGKRRNELTRHGVSGTRSVLSAYSKEFLDKNMYMCMGLANAFYALWAMEQSSGVVTATVPVALVLTMRYSLIVEGSSEGNPVDVLLKDKVLLILGLLYVSALFAVLYVF